MNMILHDVFFAILHVIPLSQEYGADHMSISYVENGPATIQYYKYFSMVCIYKGNELLPEEIFFSCTNY